MRSSLIAARKPQSISRAKHLSNCRQLFFRPLGEMLEDRQMMAGDLDQPMPLKASAGEVFDARLPAPPHFGDSPTGPEAQTDHRWFVDQGPGLDTGCTFIDGSPLVFTVEIDRVLSASDLAKMLQNGLISSEAHVRMPAFDVDFDASFTDPERDRVLFNGNVVPTEFLRGINDTWIMNEFDVPIDWVNFATDAGTPGQNTIEIHIDTLDAGWCTSIDWAEVSVEQIAAPVLFVHGILSSGEIWQTPWIQPLQAMGLHASAINLGADEGLLVLDTIQQNATDIAAAIDQITAQLNVDKVNVVAHSKGGLDTRYYMQDSDKVNRLIQIGTPNEGSPLADLIQLGVIGAFRFLPISRILAAAGPSLVNLLVGAGGAQLTTPHMLIHNYFSSFNPNSEYMALAGDYSSDSAIINFAMRGLYGGASDGIVPVSSVYGLPEIQPVGPALASTFPATDAAHATLPGFPASSPTITNSPLTFNRLIQLVTEPVTLERSELQSAPEEVEPPPPVQTGSFEGLVAQGQTVTGNLILDGAGPYQVAVIYPEGQLGIELVTPGGQTLTAALADTDPNLDFSEEVLPGFKLATFELRGPLAVPGTWQVRVIGQTIVPPATETAFFVSAFAASSPVELTAATDKAFYGPGDTINITATLTNDGAAILGATASAAVLRPDQTLAIVTLLDDGAGADAVAGDGIYTGSLANVTLPGSYQIQVEAQGTGAQPFDRQELVFATVSTSNSTLTGEYDDAGVDLNGNTLFDELVVTATFDVTAAADYQFIATLEGPQGEVIAQAFTSESLAVGQHDVELAFDGSTIFESGIDGPYTVTMLRVAEQNQLGLLPRADIEIAHTTQAYSHLDFEHDEIELLPGTIDFGVDTNGNQRFETLVVRPSVLVESAGFYQFTARLEDSAGVEIEVIAGSASLPAGISTIDLNFEGALIGEHGVNGPYFVKDLFIVGPGAANIRSVHETAPYLFTQFEGATATTGGNVTANLVGGRVVITGDAEGNSVEVFLNSDGPNTVSVRGVNGTTVNGEAGVFFFFENVFAGVIAEMNGGADDLLIDGSTLWQRVTIDGGEGDDVYRLNTTRTVVSITDEAGNDTLNFAEASSGVSVDLRRSFIQAVGSHLNRLTVSDVENIVGSDFNDTLYGNAAANRIEGGLGNDILVGWEGDDLLDGGAGNDYLVGDNAGGPLGLGQTSSISLFNRLSLFVTSLLYNRFNPVPSDDADTLLGGDGDDVLYVRNGNNLLIGGDGQDTFNAGEDEDLLIGGQTTFDVDDAALALILAEWNAPRSQTQRQANLSGTGSGARLNEDVFLTPGTTLINDQLLDRVFTRLGSSPWRLDI